MINRDGVRELLRKADEGGYAVPSFNYSDLWDFLAIAEAAEESRAPVMIASNQNVVNSIGIELCGAFGLAAMQKAKVPFVHHLDHTLIPEICEAAADHGYPSVMLDASMRPLEENVRMVKRVVEYARRKSVCVEGEVGRIKGAGIEGEFEGGEFLTAVADAVRFVEETGVDSLAVGIGTAHGFYRGNPVLDFHRLAEINDAVSVPLVLHGGTGIPPEDVRRAIRNGINKVNVGTIVHCTYMNALRAELVERGENAYTLDVMQPVRIKIKKVIKDWIDICMASGMAAA